MFRPTNTTVLAAAHALVGSVIAISAACSSCGHSAEAAGRQCRRLDTGSHQAPYFASEKGAPAPRKKQLELRVHLPFQNEEDLDALLKRLYDPTSPDYLKFLAPEDFARRFHPSAAHVTIAREALVRSGLQVDNYAHGAMLSVRGPIEKIERAFGTSMRLKRTARDNYIIAPLDNLKADGLPPFAAIHGLADHSPRKSHALHDARDDAGAYRLGFSAADVRRAYEFPPEWTGKGETIGFVQLDGYDDADLDAYAQANGIRRVPTQRVLIGSATGRPTSDGQIETTMDLQLANAMAPDADKFVVYTAKNSASGWHDMLNEIANPRRYKGPPVKYISCSWGTPEDQMTPAGVAAESLIFKQLAAQGILFVAASGDSGSKADGHHIGTDDPASQPWVLAAGGTTLTLDDKRLRKGETAWSGSGGGVSCYWPNPWWQTVKVAQPAIDEARNVPDIALHADANGPSGSYAVIVGGKTLFVGGTSAAAPIWAGIAANLGQARKAKGLPSLGALGPHIHRLGPQPAGDKAFFHIDQGSNGDYSASPLTDYDDVCGWGSARGAEFIKALSEK